MKAFEILLGYGCNEKCSFCSQELSWRAAPGLPLGLVVEQLVLAAKEGFDGVCFTGGEPTLRADLATMVACARRSGYRYIRVQTNGLRLARPEYARELVEAGANFFRVSIHGHTPELHDGLVKVPGALEKAERALENLRGLGAGIGINFVLNRANYRSLPDFCAHFLDRGQSNFVIIYPLFEGDLVAHEAEMSVGMGEVAPYVRAAFEVFRARKAPLPRLLNFTPCALPELRERMLSWSARSALIVDERGVPVDLYMASHDDRAKPAACRGCALDASCLGFKRSYLERFPAGLAPVAEGGAEEGPFAVGAEEIARALQPVPAQAAGASLLVERMKIRLDPARRALTEDRSQWSVAPHA